MSSATSSSRRRSIAVVLVASLLAAAPASAQRGRPKPAPAKPAPKPAPETGGDETQQKKDEAKERFERGMVLFDKKLWDAALAEFLQSRAAYPTRANTQNAAIALRNLNRFDEALEMFEKLVAEFPNLGEKDRQLVDKEIAELQALVGTIEVRAPEEGASVTVDGRERGATPLAPVRVPAGSHVVRVYKDGFLPFEVRVEVAGRQAAVVNAKLEALAQAGRLSVTEDAGKEADVVVDGVVVGKTPWQGRVAVGNHVVYLRGEGDLGTQPAMATVRINQVTPVVLALEPLESTLRVEPTPSGATVAIDGVVVGSGLWDGRLRKGRHKVEIAQEGFLPQERVIDLAPGKSDRLAVQLERDPNSPLWRVETPPRVFVELAPTFPIALLLGGDVSERGSESFPLGAAGRLHLGYELRSGVGFALDAGYMYLTQEVTGREAVLTPVGKPEVRGTFSDRLSLRGLLVGASAHLHRGETLPLTLRLGVGALLGNAIDRRSGELVAPSGPVPVATARTDADAAYLYVAPEIRLGYRIGKRFEVSAGADVMLMVALKAPRWDTSNAVVAGDQGLATYRDETFFGSTLLLVNPGLGARFDF